MNGLMKMSETLDSYAMTELSKDKEKVNTKELGEVVDMMKDLSEVKKNKAEAEYYCALVDAMENAEYGVDYDEHGRLGYSSGNRGGSRGGSSGGNRGGRRGYDDMAYDDDMRGYGSNRMGYSNRGRRGYSEQNMDFSRYGYSHEEFMKAKEQYSNSDPNGKTMRMQKLNEYVNDLTESAKEVVDGMSPEERQVWKTKINNLVNMQ